MTQLSLVIAVFSPLGTTKRKDERRAQQATFGHSGSTPHWIERAPPASPEGENGSSGREGLQMDDSAVSTRSYRFSVTDCCSLFSSLQNMLIQDSDGYRKQYEESIHEKVCCTFKVVVLILIRKNNNSEMESCLVRLLHHRLFLCSDVWLI